MGEKNALRRMAAIQVIVGVAHVVGTLSVIISDVISDWYLVTSIINSSMLITSAMVLRRLTK